MAIQKHTVTKEEAGQRLDILCVTLLASLSRSAIQKVIKEGNVTVNGESSKPKYIVREGDEVLLAPPVITDTSLEDSEQPELNLPILYEDETTVVINKPAGVSVHPGNGRERATVASWFVKRYPTVSDVGEDPLRPGIVHRLDKDTSGVLILAKTQASYLHLKEQFKRHRARKEYLALVFGVPGGPDGRINRALARSKRNPLRRTIDPNGKEAITEWRIEEKFGRRFGLLRLWPLTGRTHQLRVHLHFLGFPIVGDNLYTYKRQRSPQGVKRQLLHAEKLTITLLGGDTRIFVAPLAEDFANVLSELRHDVH